MAATKTKAGSLRERKKARTRAQLVDVASRLFRKQGYEETTLEQIADEADVSIRTLPRYFESKVQLALADYYDGLARFRSQLLEPGRELTTLACWREHIAVAAGSLVSTRSFALHLKFVQGVPVLAVGLLDLNRSYEDLLGAALAREEDIDPDGDLYGRMLAAMLVSGNSAAIRRWVRGGRKEDLAVMCLAVVDFAIEQFPARGTRGARRLTSV